MAYVEEMALGVALLGRVVTTDMVHSYHNDTRT